MAKAASQKQIAILTPHLARLLLSLEYHSNRQLSNVRSRRS